MKERLLEFLRSENKSSAQLAEEIGVQPSGISHILSGRNNPSLDFVLKMLEKFPTLSTDWLLFGKGSMHKDGKMHTLFDDMSEVPVKTEPINKEIESGITAKPVPSGEKELSGRLTGNQGSNSKSDISRIILFYTDNSFKEYSPRE